jgi:hypothetical protein
MDAKSGGLVDLFKGVDIIRNRNLAYYGMALESCIGIFSGFTIFKTEICAWSFDSAEDVR